VCPSCDVTRGERRDICPRAQYFGGARLRSEYYVKITKCQMSADANNYDLQNVECQQLLPSYEISSRSPRFTKRAVTNLSDVLRRSFCFALAVPACFLLTVASQCFQIARVANFPTWLSFYSCVTTGRESSVFGECSISVASLAF